MTRTLSFLGMFGLGAGVSYLLDRESGRGRRAALRDRTLRGVKSTAKSVGSGARDLSHRTQGLVAEARHLVDHEPVADDVLHERVRSKLGRLVSHPHSVKVEVRDGIVTLHGDVLPDEARHLLDGLARVRGVRHVEDKLAIHCAPEHVPSLQGGGVFASSAVGQWPPGTRLAVFALCGLSGALALRQRGMFRTAALAIGGLLTVRALANRPLSRLLGFGGRRLVEFHKTIEIDAPIDRVFAYWDNYNHFPEFMSHVRDVRNLGNGRSRWTVTGPLGLPVSWIAETSARRPNEILGWRSANGSIVKHSGLIQFESWGDGTKLEIQMTYNPPGGLFGHGLAWLFKKDPKHAMDEDLVRLKTLLEIGKTSVRHQAVLNAEVQMSH